MKSKKYIGVVGLPFFGKTPIPALFLIIMRVRVIFERTEQVFCAVLCEKNSINVENPLIASGRYPYRYTVDHESGNSCVRLVRDFWAKAQGDGVKLIDSF